MTSPPRWPRALLLVGGMASLLAGLDAGLRRVGLVLPGPSPALHGPLMVGGFLGTVIGLERAVALHGLGWRWGYLAPLLAACCSLALGLAGAPAAAFLLTASSLVYLAMLIHFSRLAPSLSSHTMAGGGLAFLVGNGCWLAGYPLSQGVLWWQGYLVLTIAGERLELSRLGRLSPLATGLFALQVMTLGLAMGVGLGWEDLGYRIQGAALLGLALWLGRYDLARKTVRLTGLPRYAALCLLSGYAWQGVSGLLMLGVGSTGGGGPLYDAQLHGLLVGFVMSMIFAHAPMIFPAVLRLPVSYAPVLYAPLALLHVSLALRLTGDLGGVLELRQVGALLNVVAILSFLACMAWRIAAAARSGRSPH